MRQPLQNRKSPTQKSQSNCVGTDRFLFLLNAASCSRNAH